MSISTIPLVAVRMLTYNHEKYIAQSIESIVSQRTNFRYILIIGEDCSTDNTSAICREYAKKYPEKIQLICNEKNDIATNSINNFNACYASGAKYLALMDGDDYWCDENKLQKQVNFLEANPEYSISFHAVNILENGKERPAELNRSDKEETYSILDLANGNIMHTPSVVFRNGLIDKFPDWFFESPVGDYVLHLLNAKKGLIKYFPEVMAVYRVHPKGAWGQKNPGEMLPKWLWLLSHLIEEDFEPQVIEKLLIQKDAVLKEYVTWALQNKRYELIATAVQQFYKDKDIAGINGLVNTLLQQVTSLEDYIKKTQQSGTYKLSKKLSRAKSFFFLKS